MDADHKRNLAINFTQPMHFIFANTVQACQHIFEREGQGLAASATSFESCKQTKSEACKHIFEGVTLDLTTKCRNKKHTRVWISVAKHHTSNSNKNMCIKNVLVVAKLALGFWLLLSGYKKY